MVFCELNNFYHCGPAVCAVAVVHSKTNVVVLILCAQHGNRQELELTYDPDYYTFTCKDFNG